MPVYIDDAFCCDDPSAWGKWTGGGHLQADTLEELHAFATRLGLTRRWFQTRTGRPENDHYDLTCSMRDRAIYLGAIPEDTREGSRRRRIIRDARRTVL